MSAAIRKTVLITGSSDPEAMGWNAGLALAKQGYRVILSGRKSDVLQASKAELVQRLVAEGQSEAEVDVRSVVLDVADPASISEAVNQLGGSDELLLGPDGVLDVLVNNAGISAPPNRTGKGASTMFIQTPEATFEDVTTVMATNVAAVVELTTPRIVNVSSARGSIEFASGLEPARTGSIVYNASKTALNMVTMMQAKNLPAHIGRPNLKVNSASPGHVATAFNNKTGTRTLEEGIAVYVHLATLPDDGPTGHLIGNHPPFSKDASFVQIPF
ncbi:hypothetical protein OC846_002203 [Tilletia horrida]|uniref:Uncharacterized protein n=1 Tax=Tilletia horrida TaxID=155126 RepID=A0AAN6JSD7_9BASI|nr:hypothetical protein OC846_002203 [Tilletia horrida]KAK0564025.1 hypothetical protein OC861_004513 [Tilletia horrida]